MRGFERPSMLPFLGLYHASEKKPDNLSRNSFSISSGFLCSTTTVEDSSNTPSLLPSSSSARTRVDGGLLSSIASDLRRSRIHLAFSFSWVRLASFLSAFRSSIAWRTWSFFASRDASTLTVASLPLVSYAFL